jgi:multidrug resistance efflux pump
MKNAVSFVRRFAVTALAVVAALAVGHYLWVYYMDAPWTRDGRVRADVVTVAPDVSGFVTEILVRDNQKVTSGDVIMRIDRARFALALQQAEAVVAGRTASLEQADLDLTRYKDLTTAAVSQQKQEQVLATQLLAKASLDQAIADRAVAQLNLDRSEVHAPVSGVISNMDLRPGTYVTAGKGVMALVDTSSLHVDGYFEETKLSRIHVGDPVHIHLMGDAAKLTGHVESVAAGIEDRDRAEGSNLLANVTPTFSWVRLAQRVPVRIALDAVPAGATLVAGRTATVEILPGNGTTIAKVN